MKKSKFIYFDKLIIHGKLSYNKNFVIDNYGGVSYDKSESIESMKEIVNDFINEDPKVTKDTFLDNYYFDYTIYILSRDHIEFDSAVELENYIEKNTNKLNKNNLYDFLVSIAVQSFEVYDFNGYLKYGYIDIPLIVDSEIYMSENDIGFKAQLFKKGDKVTKIGYPDKLYKVIEADTENFIGNSKINYNGIVVIYPLDKNEDQCEIYARSELKRVEG